jgi:hypothetical protein
MMFGARDPEVRSPTASQAHPSIRVADETPEANRLHIRTIGVPIKSGRWETAPPRK